MVQPAPNFDEERTLTSKGQFATLDFVKILQCLYSALDIRRAILARQEVSVDRGQRFGCIGHGLDGAREKSSRAAVLPVAVTTCKSGETNLEAAAASEAVGFGEDAGL